MREPLVLHAAVDGDGRLVTLEHTQDSGNTTKRMKLLHLIITPFYFMYNKGRSTKAGQLCKNKKMRCGVYHNFLCTTAR